MAEQDPRKPGDVKANRPARDTGAEDLVELVESDEPLKFDKHGNLLNKQR